jgi:MFS superfamily sulfate permease-like transporter
MALFALFVVILAQSAATSSAYAARYNEQQLSQEIADLTSSSEPALRWFCIEASAVDALDYSAAQTLRSIDETLKAKGIRLVIAQVLEGINPGSHYELDRLLGKNALYKTTEDVIKGYKLELDLCRGANETGAPHKNKG